MTETTPSPFDPFKPSTPPSDAPAADKPKRKRASGKRKAKTPATNGIAPVAAEPAAPKKTRQRKKRERKATVRGPLKIEFGTAMALAAEMKPADTELFGQIVVALQKVGKGSRSRIAIALGKMFA